MTSGWHGHRTVFQEVRPGAGFKTGDFVEEMLGEGYLKMTPLLVYVLVYDCAQV